MQSAVAAVAFRVMLAVLVRAGNCGARFPLTWPIPDWERSLVRAQAWESERLRADL